MSVGQVIPGAFGTRVGPLVDATPSGGSSQDPERADTGGPHVRPDAARVLVIPRQRDRRQGLLDLLSTVTRVLVHEQDVALMRGAFEEALRALVPVRAIQLRELGSRWAGRLQAVPSVESITLEVPGRDQGTRGQLEAAFDPGCRLGEWDFQVLAVATHVGALVLEIERTRTQLARAGLLNRQRPHRDGPAPLIGSTDVMKNLRATIERVASTDFTVLLEGETGVGKELVARQIHECSRRRTGPFVAINCAALVETLLEAELFGIEDRTATGVRGRTGKFEHADAGTLFLDEVSDLSPSAQSKLLRVIQDLSVQRVGGRSTHRLDIRIVAATNQRLADLVERQRFRPDLFYRLSGVDIRVPTLRERTADIMELARYFLDRFRVGRPLQFSSAAAAALITYPWPGNVRELERAMERVVTLTEGDVIALDDLPASVRGPYSSALGPSLTRNETMRVWACRYARLVVDRCRGNKRAACRALGISYHTLQAYLRVPLVPKLDDRVEAGISDVEDNERPCNEPAGIQNTNEAVRDA